MEEIDCSAVARFDNNLLNPDNTKLKTREVHFDNGIYVKDEFDSEIVKQELENYISRPVVIDIESSEVTPLHSAKKIEMKIQGETCTLCLEKCENFKAIDGNTKDVLDILLPKIDFTVIQGPGMCKNCEEMLMKCFNFKAKCLQTQNYIVSFLNNKGDVTLNLKDVYLSSNVTVTSIPEDQDICGFCMGLVKNCSAVSVDVEEGDVMLEKMIQQCLPELDLSIIKRPVICASCHGYLEDCFHFVTECLIAGENIKKDCKTPDINSKSQIELSSSLQRTIREVTTREVDDNLSDIIVKVEEEFCEDRKNLDERKLQLTIREVDDNSADIVKVEEGFCEDRKNPDEREISYGADTVKLEQFFFDESVDANKDAENKNIFFLELNDQEVKNEGESNKLGSIKIEEILCEENENLVEKADQKFLLNEEIEIKTDEQDFNSYEDGNDLPQSEVTRRSYKCDYCSLQTENKGYLEGHLLTHRNLSKVKLYKCHSCSFQAKCKSNLTIHLMRHKDPSEVTMYKRDSCLYQTKHIGNLKSHLLVHKNPSEVTMYKCDHCSFQTKHNNCLKTHLLTHKDPSEVTMYTCDSCSYRTKYRNQLKKHLLVHKNPSEVTMYKCDHCSFQTKYKCALKNHLLKHRNPSEVTMYKCDSCSFETKYKYALRKHLLLHKNPSEVTMYECDHCSFQTKYNGNLKRHLLIPEIHVYDLLKVRL